jgi:hypothetical protein
MALRVVTMNSAERLPVLDGLRAISILLVLATHMLPIGPKVLRLNETAGAMGMSLFFSLFGLSDRVNVATQSRCERVRGAATRENSAARVRIHGSNAGIWHI